MAGAAVAGFGLDGVHAAWALTAFGLGELKLRVASWDLTACVRGCLMDARIYKLSCLKAALEKKGEQ